MSEFGEEDDAPECIARLWEWFRSLRPQSFAYRDLIGQDRWESWTPTVSMTIVGSPTYAGRFRVVGRLCEFQVKFTCSGGNTVACTAGTSYIALPIAAKGYGGLVLAFDTSAKTAHGAGGIDVTNSRAYPAGWVASTVDVVVAGSYEV